MCSVYFTNDIISPDFDKQIYWLPKQTMQKLWEISGCMCLHRSNWELGWTDSSGNRDLKDNFQTSLWFPLYDILADYES